MDTAELPRVTTAPPLGAMAGEPLAVLQEPPPARQPDRLVLRAERRQERRQRRLYALLGIAVLMVVLFATVAVLDMVR